MEILRQARQNRFRANPEDTTSDWDNPKGFVFSILNYYDPKYQAEEIWPLLLEPMFCKEWDHGEWYKYKTIIIRRLNELCKNRAISEVEKQREIDLIDGVIIRSFGERIVVRRESLRSMHHLMQ